MSVAPRDARRRGEGGRRPASRKKFGQKTRKTFHLGFLPKRNPTCALSCAGGGEAARTATSVCSNVRSKPDTSPSARPQGAAPLSRGVPARAERQSRSPWLDGFYSADIRPSLSNRRCS